MNTRSIQSAATCVLAMVLAAGAYSARAQDAGPMTPPASERFPTPPPAAKPAPPAIPPEEIIRRFAAKEDEMFHAILGYTFQKSVRIEEIGPDNKPSGHLEIITQRMITPDGRVYERMVHRSASTLQYLDIERGDDEKLVSTPMFPLTTAQLPNYVITYGGKQPLDELTAYYFSVKPRALNREHAYFSGVVWVDTRDLVIVKSIGKWVTETGDVTSPSLPFTIFETYRQPVGKDLWFPAYASSDETIDAGNIPVPVRMIIRWTGFTPMAKAPAAAPSPSGESGSSKGTP